MSALLLAGLLAVQGLQDRMTSTAGVHDVATEFLEAFRTDDDDAMAEVATALRVDPFLVADALLVERSLDAAQAFAERVGDASLICLTVDWSSWSEEELAEDARLRKLLASGGVSFEAALESAPAGVTAVRLQVALAARRVPIDERAAADAYVLAAERAGVLRWYAERCRNQLRAGLLLVEGGDWQEGMSLLDEALAGCRSLEHRVQLAWLLRHAGLALYQQARLDSALEAMDFALQEALADDDWEDAVYGRLRISMVCIEQGRLERSLEVLRPAYDDAEEHGDELLMAIVRGEMGNTYDDMGRFREALESHRFAYEEKKRLGHRKGAAISLLNVGLVLRAMGQLTDALDAYEEAREESLAVGDRGAAAALLNNIATVYNDLGFHEKALDYGLRSIEEKERLGMRRSLTYSYSVVSAAYGSLGEHQKGLEYALLSHREMEAMGGANGAFALGEVGRAYLDLGDTRKGLEVLQRAQEEVAAAGIAGQPFFVGFLNDIGQAHYELGDTEQALECYGRAIELAEAGGLLKLAADLLNTHTGYLLEEGRPEEALQSATRSVEHRVAGTRDLGAFLGGRIRGRAADAAEQGLLAIAELSAKSDDDGLLDRAFWFTENGRGLLLAETLVNREALRVEHLSPEVLGAEVSARRRLRTARARLHALAGSGEAAEKSLVAARAELDAAYAGLEDVIGRAERESHRAMGVVAPRAVELSAVQALLSSETALVYYQNARPHLYALVVTRDAVDLVRLGEQEDLYPRVERYLRIVARPDTDEEELAGELYASLLAPLEQVLEGRTRLLISPDGILSFLPFEALLRREAESAVRALERWDIAYMPSATVYAALREDAAAHDPGTGLVALGDPVYPRAEVLAVATTRALELRGVNDLPPLPESGAEVRAIADLFPEDASRLLLQGEASVAGLSAALAEVDGRLAALHLACHGYVDTERPFLTGLVLSGAEILSVHDVYKLRIPADLVVLSACETGRGQLQRGEGVLGLARAFFFAGSPRVVVSNWKVDDESTRSLMVSTYARIAEGAAPGAALRAAKLERFRRGGVRAHPYHWAAFVLWGLSE